MVHWSRESRIYVPDDQRDLSMVAPVMERALFKSNNSFELERARQSSRLELAPRIRVLVRSATGNHYIYRDFLFVSICYEFIIQGHWRKSASTPHAKEHAHVGCE